MKLAGLTPLTLDLAAAFPEPINYGPWEFYPADAELYLDDDLVAPTSWTEIERLAGDRPDAVRWLASLREDAERRLAVRARSGSVWGASERAVNATLELLLSRAFDGVRAPEHDADLDKSGLTRETRDGACLRSVLPKMISRLIGFDPAGVRSALLFPHRGPAGGFMDYVSVKVFPGLKDAEGHSIKYLGRRGVSSRLYLPPASLRAATESDAPLWLVEGAKKVGLVAVGFSGVEGWHCKGSRELLPDFDALPLAGRTVELLPDGDVQTNPNVERGVGRLADALRRRGALPRLVVLPSSLEEAGR